MLNIKHDNQTHSGMTEKNILRAASALQYVSPLTAFDMFVEGDKNNPPMDRATAHLVVKAGEILLNTQI